MVSWFLRLAVFLMATISLYCAVILLDVGLLPEIARRANDGTYPEGYQPSVGLAAIVICCLVTTALFRKIFLRRRVKATLIAVTLYVLCNGIAFMLLISGQQDLAASIGWVGLVGVVGYYVLRLFKKPMISQEPTSQ